jgi:thiol-disulfide isomerase/thioredoxin
VKLYIENPNLRITWNQTKNKFKEDIFLIRCKERYEKETTYLENQKQNVSPLFYDLCKKYFFVEYLTNLLYLYSHEKREDVRQILLNHKEYIQDEDLLFSQKYKGFCMSYAYGFLLNLDSNSYLQIKDNFNGKIRDYFLFDLIKMSKKEEVLNTFLSDCRDEDYKNYINWKLKVRRKFSFAKDSLFQSDLVPISLEEILFKYKGKIIYVDIWASWCGPCRALMPKSHKLKEQFKEDVAFIYLSIDENAELWRKTARNEGIDEQNSYLISEESSFIKEHKVVAIPRYMIFDRNGELIVDDAMRPNNKNFVEEMNEIIQ